jgi:hypothetical protein
MFIYFFRKSMAKYTQCVFFSRWKKSSFTSVEHRIGQKLKIYRIQNKYHVDYVNSVSMHSPIEILRNSGHIDERCQLNRHPSMELCSQESSSIRQHFEITSCSFILDAFLLFTSTKLVPDSSVINVHHNLQFIPSVM